jgi:hypothetical protein
MAERQNIERSDKLTIGALLRRIEAARRFPDNTDPCVRHVQIMGETLGAGHAYPILDEERGHCAISLLSVVADLYEARTSPASPAQPMTPEHAQQAFGHVGSAAGKEGKA